MNKVTLNQDCSDDSFCPARNLPKYLSSVFTLLIILLACNAHAQWEIQSPIPTYLDIRGVAAPTTQHVFLATGDDQFDNGGALFESLDGGATWAQLAIPTNLDDPLNGIFFLDSQTGWTFGNVNYKTIDGGTSWTEMPLIGSTYRMEFYTPSLGLATIGLDHLISYDGGDSWAASPENISRLAFGDSQTGLGISLTGIYRTTDGGSTFNPSLAGIGYSAAFLSASVAVSIVNDTIWRSDDGGATWSTVIPAEGRSDLLAVSPDVVLAWGRSGFFPDLDGRIFRSADGGLTWSDLGEVMFPDPYGLPFTFALLDAQTIVASDGGGGMFRSADAGLTWTQSFDFEGSALPSTFSTVRPVFADAQTGYFGFGGGIVIKTIDAGNSWAQISSGTSQPLMDIDRFPNGDLMAVGEQGTLLTSAGGNAPWSLHPAFSQYDLVAVQILNASEVVVLDEVGQVFTSLDAGSTWTAADSIPAGLSPGQDIHFSTPLDGWILGQGFDPPGLLYHTTDGGSSWTAAHGFGGAYVALDVVGTTIWAANVTGRFYKSTDNGDTWIQMEIPGSPHLILDMDFYDENIGYATGWWGEAFRTDNGGLTWQELPTPNEDDQLTDIYLLGPDDFWVSTRDDAAYYTANGGQGWALLETNLGNFSAFNGIAASPEGDAWMVGERGHIMHFNGPPGAPLNQPPTGSIAYNATGLTVEFADSSTDLDGTIVAWYWDFDDGTFSTEQHPTHVYAEANTYWVELTVTDDDGATGGGFAIITVQPLPGGTFGDFTEVTPHDSLFVTPLEEDFWVVTTAPADYDNDGDLDIAVLGYYVVYSQWFEEHLFIFRNDGPEAGVEEWNFTYYDVPLGTLSTGASDLAWGDADGDGDQDLVVGSDGQTVLYKNLGGILIMTDTELPGYYEDNFQADFDLRSITWADYDNDGDLDLLLPSVYDVDSFSYRTALMRNDGPNGSGGWTFTETDPVFAPTSHAQSAWADYDGDQDLDLLLVHMGPLYDDGFIIRYRNDGNGEFTAEYPLDSLAIRHGEAQWGDYDGDGDLDILVVGDIDNVFDQVLTAYRNDNETYVPIDVITCSFCEGWFDLNAATWADYDSDGDVDVLVAGNYSGNSNIEGRARIYTNSGGVFTADTAKTLPAPLSSGDRGGSFTWLDIDNDGDLDYFIAGQYYIPGGNNSVQSEMHLYRNDIQGENAAPSTPTELRVTMQEDDVVQLSWNASDDDHTPGAALTYDLDIFRDNAPVSSAYRLPEPGNISAVTDWLINGLEDGDYEWTLRAVDASYLGSPVATSEFTVGIQTDVELIEYLDKGFSLAQNYPNPFNSKTIITFSLADREHVELKVYDVLGNEIITLVNKELTKGLYHVEFDAAGLSPGTYLYTLKAGNYNTFKKMQVLK